MLEEYQQLNIFQGLNVEQLEHTFGTLDFQSYSKDQEIYVQGANATNLYILVKGRVAVRYKPYDGPVLTIATIIPGLVFGWSALLGRKKYTSGAVSLQESTVLSISTENLQKICKINDETGIIFLERISHSIKQTIDHSEIQDLSSFFIPSDWVPKG